MSRTSLWISCRKWFMTMGTLPVPSLYMYSLKLLLGDNMHYIQTSSYDHDTNCIFSETLCHPHRYYICTLLLMHSINCHPVFYTKKSYFPSQSALRNYLLAQIFILQKISHQITVLPPLFHKKFSSALLVVKNLHSYSLVLDYVFIMFMYFYILLCSKYVYMHAYESKSTCLSNLHDSNATQKLEA